jgi:hypothetical protein
VWAFVRERHAWWPSGRRAGSELAPVSKKIKRSHGKKISIGVEPMNVDSVERDFHWKSTLKQIELKSLILAQIERWRHALHMQVERQHGGNPGGEWRTGE